MLTKPVLVLSFIAVNVALTFAPRADAQEQPTLTLTSPNGGEVFNAGSDVVITWTSTNTQESVQFYLFAGEQGLGYIGDAPMSSGRLNWRIPPAVNDRADCRIRMVWYSPSGQVDDFSDGGFTILGSVTSPALTLLSPNGGEHIDTGSVYTIRWALSHDFPKGYGREVYFYLSKDGAEQGYLGSAEAYRNEFSWQVCPGIEPGEGYSIRMVSWDFLGGVEDWSDSPLAIDSTIHPSLSVSRPAAGEVVEAGKPLTVRWSSTDLGGMLGIELWQGSRYRLDLGFVPLAAGALTTVLCPTIGDGAEYYIRVNQRDGMCRQEADSAAFSIIGSLLSPLRVISPNGGEVLDAGSLMTVTWESDMEESRGGPAIDLVKGGTPAESMVCWATSGYTAACQIDASTEPASDYSIRLRSSDCSGYREDSSDEPFTIRNAAPPSLKVLSPNGGETVRADQPMIVRWASENLSAWVYGELYRGGTRFSLLGHVPAQLGQMSVSLCPLVTDGSSYTVRLSAWDGWSSTPEDTSDAPFTIVGTQSPPPLTLTGPAPGSAFAPGDDILITWTGSDSAWWLTAYLQRGDDWVDMLGVADVSDGQMPAKLSTGYEAGDDYYIALMTTGDCGPNRQFVIGPFTILPESRPEPHITLTSPNGGEVIRAGTRQVITWTAEHGIGNVYVTLVKNGVGVAYPGIVPVSSCRLDWDVCDYGDDGGDYTIFLSACAWSYCAQDESDASFTIAGASPSPEVHFRPIAPGEAVVPGETRAIGWDVENSSGDLRLTLHNGYSIPLAEVAMADRGYSWQVCPTLPAGIYYLLATWRVCERESTEWSYAFVVAGPGDPSADLDHNCIVDSNDVRLFEKCSTGPAILYDVDRAPEGCAPSAGSGNGVSTGFLDADLDRDGDVDQSDFGILQVSFTGPQR